MLPDHDQMVAERADRRRALAATPPVIRIQHGSPGSPYRVFTFGWAAGSESVIVTHLKGTAGPGDFIRSWFMFKPEGPTCRWCGAPRDSPHWTDLCQP
jgi:hypothetical protein